MVKSGEDQAEKGAEEIISNTPQKPEGVLLVLDGNAFVDKCDIDRNSVYLSICCCFCCVKGIIISVSEEQFSKQRDPKIEIDKYIIIFNDRYKYWTDKLQDSDDYRMGGPCLEVVGIQKKE